MTTELSRNGYSMVASLLPRATRYRLAQMLPGHQAGTRNLLAIPAVRELANSPEVRGLVTPILGDHCFAVRGILFDKSPASNWKVPWHQDLLIAVREKVEVHGYGPWSVKAGIVHVQPPDGVLARMVTVRLHLDDCGPRNGPLRVLPGSHERGRLQAAEIQKWQQKEAVTCCLPAGGALVMRPLLLHASSTADNPCQRRVIHLEFTADELPNPLTWHEKVAPALLA